MHRLRRVCRRVQECVGGALHLREDQPPALLPQGAVERYARVVNMVERHDAEGFGSCSNEGECEAVCPKEISITNIARMNREYLKAMLVIRLECNPAFAALPGEMPTTSC